MNKLNNNEALQMNTVMPTIKKSLLALAVAGSMAMSGGAAATVTVLGATVVNLDSDNSGTAYSGTVTTAASAGFLGGATTINGTTTSDMGAIADGSGVASLVIGGAATTSVLGMASIDTAKAVTIGSNINALDVTVSVSGDIDLTGSGSDGILLVGNAVTAAASNKTTTLDVTGDVTISGATTVTAGEDSGTANAQAAVLTVGGDAVFTGLLSITADTLGDATVTLKGGATLTGGAVLNELDAGNAKLVFNGAAIQAVTGVIDGGNASEGHLVVNNAAGVTFAGAIGGTADLFAINIGTVDNENSTVTFAAHTDATTWTLGNGGTVADTITATWNIAADATNVGAITANAFDIVNMTITDSDGSDGDDKATFSGLVSNIDNLTVGSTALGGSAIFTAHVSAEHVVVMGGDGAGENSSLTFTNNLTATDITLNDVGGETATITFDDATSQTITGKILAESDGEGAIVVAGLATKFIDDIGTTGDTAKRVKSILVSNGTDSVANFDGNVYADNIGITATGSGDPATATFAKNVDGIITLTDDTALATATFDGSDAQVVSGTIVGGGTDGFGTVLVTNTSGGVTFQSNIGGAAADGSDDILDITIGTATTGSSAVFEGLVFATNDILVGINTGVTTTTSSATFKKTVTADTIKLGGSNSATTSHTNTVTFDSTDANITVTGAISGVDTTNNNNNLVVSGANTTTFATTMGDAIDQISVNTGSTLSTANAKLIKTAKLTGLGTLNIANGVTTTITGAADDEAFTVDIAKIVLNDATDNDGLTINAGTGTATISSAITTAATGTSLITIEDDAGTVVFNADIGTSNVTVAELVIAGDAANVVNASANLYIDAITIDGDAVASLNLLGTSQTVSGAISGVGAKDGVVNVGIADGSILSNVTFDGIIGGTTINAFNVLNKATANISKTVSIESDDHTSDGLDVAIGGTLNIASAAANNVTLLITDVAGDVDLNGTVKVTGAEHTKINAKDDMWIDGTLTTLLAGTAKTLDLTSEGNIILIGKDANTTINAGNQIVLNGNTTIGGSAVTTTINIKATADFNPDTAAVIDATGDTVTLGGGLKVALDSNTGLIANNASITVIESDEALAASLDYSTTNFVTLVDTAIIDLVDNSSDTKDLKIKVVYKTAADGVTGQNSSAIVSALTAATNANNQTEWAAVANLTSAQTENAAEQLQPDMGAANGAALASVSGVNSVIAGRQANTRVAFNTLGKQSGVSTGDAANDAVVWAQIFGSTASQDKVGTIDGYDADSTGLALGWETEKSGDLLGLSVSYSDVDVDGKSATASKTDATSTQAAVYGTYGQATDWMVGYALGSNDTSRTINFGGLSSTAKGSYDSDIFSAKVGHTFDATGSFTPKADLSWTHIMNGSYTETGAGNLGLVVGSSTNDIVTARMGVEFSQRNESNGDVTVPRFSVMAGYDLVNDGAESSVSYIGGGTAFTTKAAAPEKVSLDLGVGVDHVSDDSTVSLDFNANLRDAYDSMTGSLTFKSKF